MTYFDLTVRVIHILGASIWIGAAFFVAWFLSPALNDVGPDGGKVMAALQKRGWMVAFPIVATLTILSGIYLYRPYMGAEGNAAMLYGYGGVLGIAAYALGIAVVSRSLLAANKLSAKAATMAEGSDRAAKMAEAGKLRRRGFVVARVVSLLVIAAALLMSLAPYV